MARPTKYAALICFIVTIVALVGIIAGLFWKNPLVTIFLLVPAVIYEVYRTEGKSTTAASWLLLVVYAAFLFIAVFDLNFNLAELLGASHLFIGGYQVPLGDVKVVGPALVAVLSAILFFRTRGIYTRWLAVVIFATSAVIIYMVEPVIIDEVIRPLLQRTA